MQDAETPKEIHQVKTIGKLCACKEMVMSKIVGILIVVCPHARPRYFKNGCEIDREAFLEIEKSRKT